MGSKERQDPLPKDQHRSRRGQGAAEHRSDQTPRRAAVDAEAGQREQGQRGHWNAAGGEPADDAPIDVPVEAVNQGPGALRRRRVEQIGPHRGRRVNAEQQNQKRGHQ